MTPVSWLLPAITYLMAQDHCWSQYLHAGYVQSIYQCNGTSLHPIFAGELQLLVTFLKHWYLFSLISFVLLHGTSCTASLCCCQLEKPSLHGSSTNSRTDTSYCRYSDIFLNTCTCLYRLRYKFNWYPYKWLVMK